LESTARRPGIKGAGRRLLLLAFGCGLALSLGEVLMRCLAPQPLNGFWTIDTPTGLCVNKSGGQSRHQFGRRQVRYRFFPPHLRDTPVRDGAIHVLMLGDSFTFGWLLAQKDTYVHCLQELADAEFGAGILQFLNAAVGGWGTADYVAYVEEFGDLIRPDVVLVFIHTDDIGRSLRHGLYEFAGPDTRELVRRPVTAGRLKHVAKRLPGCQFLFEHSHLAQGIRSSVAALHQRVVSRRGSGSAWNRLAASAGLERADESQVSVLFGRALFLRLQDWCTARGAALYVTTTGRHDPAPPADPTREPTRAFMAQAEEFFQSAQVT
jgi:hypothetical protein